MTRPTIQYWKFLFPLLIACTWSALLFQGITTSLGESHWRRTSQGWEAAADSRPTTSGTNASEQHVPFESVLIFKSLGLQLDIERVHAGHRMVLPVAIAGLMGSLGVWFLLWDRRIISEQA